MNFRVWLSWSSNSELKLLTTNGSLDVGEVRDSNGSFSELILEKWLLEKSVNKKGLLFVENLC